MVRGMILHSQVEETICHSKPPFALLLSLTNHGKRVESFCSRDEFVAAKTPRNDDAIHLQNPSGVSTYYGAQLILYHKIHHEVLFLDVIYHHFSYLFYCGKQIIAIYLVILLTWSYLRILPAPARRIGVALLERYPFDDGDLTAATEIVGDGSRSRNRNLLSVSVGNGHATFILSRLGIIAVVTICLTTLVMKFMQSIFYSIREHNKTNRLQKNLDPSFKATISCVQYVLRLDAKVKALASEVSDSTVRRHKSHDEEDTSKGRAQPRNCVSRNLILLVAVLSATQISVASAGLLAPRLTDDASGSLQC